MWKTGSLSQKRKKKTTHSRTQLETQISLKDSENRKALVTALFPVKFTHNTYLSEAAINHQEPDKSRELLSNRQRWEKCAKSYEKTAKKQTRTRLHWTADWSRLRWMMVRNRRVIRPPVVSWWGWWSWLIDFNDDDESKWRSSGRGLIDSTVIPAVGFRTDTARLMRKEVYRLFKVCL